MRFKKDKESRIHIGIGVFSGYKLLLQMDSLKGWRIYRIKYRVTGLKYEEGYFLIPSWEGDPEINDDNACSESYSPKLIAELLKQYKEKFKPQMKELSEYFNPKPVIEFRAISENNYYLEIK